jgi:Family of unknown function (DUF6029)
MTFVITINNLSLPCMNWKKIIGIILLSNSINAFAQISGELQANANFYENDTNIVLKGNPLYENFKSGGESWLALRYSGSNGFNANVRIDGFQNSNILNPNNGFTDAGIGMYNISKEWDKLTISAGHIYDQIGTGIIYRAYEDRALLIDNALFGVQLKYAPNDHITIKGFSGQVRNLFSRYNPTIKGLHLEADYDIKKAHITPGIGLVNRTLDKASMDAVVNTINGLPESERFIPKYNYYAATLYNTLNVGNISWYIEGAAKSAEGVNNAQGKLVNKSGQVLFSTIGWAIPKFGVNASFKRTQDFALRTSPNESALRGFTNWQPIIAAIRPQRLLARYTPASQDFSEQSYTLSSNVTPNDKYTYAARYTNINNLDGKKLYREFFAESVISSIKNTELHLGYQNLFFNQAVFQQDGTTFTANTFFAEVVRKLSDKQSIKTDIQYMNGVGDFGSWVFALMEYDIAPKWAFAISDMYNISTNANFVLHPGLTNKHYPNVFVAYTQNSHRFTAQYVKQVAGINCTGGVCRYEPAFSGFKIGVTSSF